jgi:soluble cytochrome b562
MKAIHTLIAGAVVLALAAPLASAQDASKKKLYCWDEGGRKVCGDALPAHAVDSARTEISAKSGLATAQVDRALSAEERAAAEQAARAARSAATAAEAQKRRDRAMTESYATEDDLRKSFQERIVLLDETVKASQLGIEGRRQTVLSLLRKAGEAELNSKPVGSGLAENIRGQHDELLHQQDVLKQQVLERSLADQDLATALERYNALKAKNAAGG